MSGGPKKILVIESDGITLRLITTSLEVDKYDYRTAENGRQAIAEAVTYQPDIIITGLVLPDMDGIDLIKKIRTWSNVPIIIISMRTDYTDIEKGLDSGADDYLCKPFNVTEMLARIRAAIRRSDRLAVTPSDNSVFINGKLKIDYAAGTVFVNGEEVHLTPHEYKLLCLFARNTDKVLTYSYILKEVWGGDPRANLKILRVFMSGLRKKIEPDARKPVYIFTQAGIGYRMPKIQASTV